MSNNDVYPTNWLYRYLLDLMLFLLILTVISISFCLSINKYHGAVDWFQRSGTIATLCSAFIEYRYLAVYKCTTHQSIISGGISDVPLLSFLARIVKFAQKNAFIILVIGTLIGGYGDLPFR